MNINGIMVAGDIAGSSDSNVVVSISGSSPFNITPNILQWATNTTVPILSQNGSATTAGQALTIQAQGSTGSTTNGGNLVLASGNSSFGTVGNIQLQLGTITGLSLTATGSLQFGSTITGTVTQATASATGGNLSITAQSAGGSGNNGGSLVLSSGSSASTGTSGNVTINTATPGGSNPGNILFEISGTTQAFVTTNTNGTGLGIGSTPGTSPTITSGSGVPSSTEPNGSIYLNTNLGANTIYTRQSGSWSSLPPTGSVIVPLTETIVANTSHSTYTVDSTSGSADGIILHNYTGSTTGYAYVMPAPTAGRQIIIRDITGTIETTNQTGGLITGSGTTSKVIFVAPHGTESFNGSSGFTLTGTNFIFTNGSPTVTATSSQFTTQLAPGMSIVPVGGIATTTASYIIQSITNATTLVLTANYTGTTSTTGTTAKMNSLAYYANYGTLTLFSDGTNWFASSNKPLRAYLTATVSNGVFVPSPGCTAIQLVGCGGGGAGGGGTGGNSGGGGGGGALQSIINTNITPNTSYAITIGAGGTASAGITGGIGGNTIFGTIAYFYGASGGAVGSSTNYSSGGMSFISASSTNVGSSNNTAGDGSSSIATTGTQITSSTIQGIFAMGGAGSATSLASFAGLGNITGNGSYSGGAAGSASTFGGGGGGAGPQGSGGAGGATTAGGTSASANTGAGGGGGGGNASTSGGTGGSGYLYVYTWM